MVKSIIENIILTPLREIADGRGAVLHMLRSDSPEFKRFGECYFSEILPGVVKGWKRHLRQTQNIAVPVGLIRIVIYDDRENSKTRGKLLDVVLGRPEHYMRIQIPPMIWYAFSCISDTPALLANCADIPHEPDECEVLPLSAKNIPYHW